MCALRTSRKPAVFILGLRSEGEAAPQAPAGPEELPCPALMEADDAAC